MKELIHINIHYRIANILATHFEIPQINIH